MGTSFIDSSIRDVEFKDCIAKYVNFSGARFERVIFTNSEFLETTFLENKLKNVEFVKIDFSRSEIRNCDMAEVDFSSCILNDISIDLESMRGIIIDRFQAIDLVRLLGVKFKE